MIENLLRLMGFRKIHESSECAGFKFFFCYRTCGDEDDECNNDVLTITTNGKWTKWISPFKLGKPIKDYDGNYERNGEQVKYTVFVPRILLKISICSEYFNVKINSADSELLKNETKFKDFFNGFYNFPWVNFKQEREFLLNPDGSVFIELTGIKERTSCIPWLDLNIDTILREEMCGCMKLKAVDKYDGEQINVTAIQTLGLYSRGDYYTKKYTIANLVNKIITLYMGKAIIRRIEINFDREVGSRKGSWKGGTLGISACIQDGETFKEAFMRIIGKERLKLAENDDTFYDYSEENISDILETLNMKQKEK